MLTLYGADLSSPSNKVRFLLNDLGMEYHYHKISIRDKQNQTPEFLRLNPVGKIPVIEDDGFILFESDAIIKYVAQKARSPLYPTDLKSRARVDQWMDFISIHINEALGRVLFNRVFAPLAGVNVDESVIVSGLKMVKRFLPVIDQQLSISTQVASNERTLADFSLLSVLDPAEAAGIDLGEYVHLFAWRTKWQQESFYLKCHRSYKESLARMKAAVGKKG